MPLPTQTLNVYEEAESVHRHLKMIKRDADYAKSLKADDVIRLRHQLYRSGMKFTALSDAGLGTNVLGPVIGDMLKINWQDHEAEYLQLIQTDIPAFIFAVDSNSDSILVREFNADKDQYKELSQSIKDTLLPLINNISNALG